MERFCVVGGGIQCRIFHPVLKTIREVWHEINGEKHGPHIYFDERERMSARIEYAYDLRHGLSEVWRYVNGRGIMVDRSHWHGGKQHGIHEIWHENGHLSQVLTYCDGLRQGMHEEWYPSGQLACRRFWVDNEACGLYEAYDDKGRPLSILSWLNNNYHGRKTTYYYDSTTADELYEITIEMYSHGKMLESNRLSREECRIGELLDLAC